MKTIAMIATLSLFLGACAMQNEPVTDDDTTVEPDAGVDPQTDAGPVTPTCGNDQCENGETAASCWDDCNNGDPTCDPDTWAAWSVKDDMRFDPAYCPGTKGDDGTYWATLVGDCAAEGISWTSGKRLTRHEGENWVYDLIGSPQECHVTLKDCNVPNTTCPGGPTWNSFLCPGSPVGVNTEASGPYGWYGYYLGDDEETGHFAFQGNPGGAAEPRGILTCGP